MPTPEQAYTAVFVCQMLSNMFQPITVFRYDKKFKTIYIQAGVNDSLEILITEEGDWDFEQ